MRKKILLNAMIIFCVVEASAQFQKGQFYIGIEAGKRFVKYNALGIQPSGSIGLNDHSVAGIFFDYSKQDWDYTNHNGDIKNYGVGIFYNYAHYFGKQKKWGWFVSSALSFNQIRATEINSGTNLNSHYNQTRLAFTPGIFYKLTPNIMLQLNVGDLYFSHDKYQFFNVRSSLATQINIGVIIGFGNSSDKKRIAKTTY
jgi:hypothetical protein